MAAPMLLSKYFGNLSKIIDSERIKAYSSTDFVDIDLVSYSDFFANYLVPNKPCIFSPTLTRNWKSRQEWVSADGAPNFDFLVDEFGDFLIIKLTRHQCIFNLIG
ncbi:JmjC domain-containing protein 4 [Mactra antiquata]